MFLIEYYLIHQTDEVGYGKNMELILEEGHF